MEQGDCSHLLERHNPSTILRKAIVLFEHQVTKSDHERQRKIFNQYLTVSKNGFLVRDLPFIMYLQEAFRSRMEEQRDLEGLMVKFLEIAAIPPVIIKPLDILEYARHIQEFFSWLGYLLVWTEQKNLQINILDTLYSLLTTKKENKKYLSLDIRKEKAECSMLADILGEMLELADDDIYENLLRVVQVLIVGSKHTCEILLKKESVNIIIMRLEPTWRRRFPTMKPFLPSGAEEIFNTETIFQILNCLLSYANNKNTRAPTKFTLWSLQWALRLFTLKETTKVERNNILAILLLLMEIYPDLLSGNLTLSYDIAMLAMSKDIIFHQNWTTQIELSTSNLDLSFIALLLMCISYFPNCLSGPKVIEETRVVMGLLKLIGHQQTIKWSSLQACRLIRLALNILHKIVPASTEEFVEDGGPLTILHLLGRVRQNPQMYNFAILYRSVQLLAHLAFKFKSVRDSITYNGGLDYIMPLCEIELEREYLNEDKQLLLRACICLLEQICTTEEVNKVMSAIIIKYMKRFISPMDMDPLQCPKLIIICLSFVWNKVAYSLENSKQFFKMGGIYLMLDIIQIGCLPVKLAALGALIDLCEITQCIPYLITWRRNGQRIKSLLADVFREENKEMLVKMDDNGVIVDPTLPLIGKRQFYETYCMCHVDKGNPSLADLFVNCRPRVYCLLQILNVKQKEIVEIADDNYRLYNEELSGRDEVILLVAENFLALKLAEQWKEIENDFEHMNMEPVPLDAITIKAMIDITDKWSATLKQMQEDALYRHKTKEWREEQALYNKLREARLTGAWDALSQMKYIARCTERMFRVTLNVTAENQINSSLMFDESKGTSHRTYQSKLSISCLKNQSIMLSTDVFEEITASKVPKFVSPVPSQVSLPEVEDKTREAEYLDEDKDVRQMKCKSEK